MEKGPDYYRRLKRALLLATLAVSLVPLFVLSFTASTTYQRHYKQSIVANIEKMAQGRIDAVNTFLADQATFLAVAAELFPYDYLRRQENLERVFVVLRKNSALVDIGVINEEGRHDAYVGPYRQIVFDKDYHGQEWFRQVAVKGSHISDVFRGYRNIPHIVIAVAGPDRRWVLRATLDTEIFNTQVRHAAIGLGGEAFIVNAAGVIQAAGRFKRKELAAEEAKLLEHHRGVRVEELRSKGRRYLYATSWVQDKDWILVVKVDLASQLEPFYRARKYDLVIVILGVLVIVTSAVLILNFLVRKIEAGDRLRAAYDDQMVHAEKIAAIGRLAAGVAHEVNNPLQIIGEKVGWMEELLAEEECAGVKNFSEYEEALKKIRLHVDRARRVTHRLLRFSRRVEGDRGPVDINYLITETISFLEKELLFHQIELTTELGPDLSPVVSSGSEIQQVFLNVLNNSIDAIEGSGTIRITTYQTERSVVAEFADSGQGIPSELLDRVFEPFFTTKQSGKGTGLGLSVSYSLIKKLGGDIRVSSKVGEGTVFKISLPKDVPGLLEEG